MSTPTHVSDRLRRLPCRTPSQANRSTRATSPPSRTVPVTHLATATPLLPRPEAPVEVCGSPSQLALVSGLHIDGSSMGHPVAIEPNSASGSPDERARHSAQNGLWAGRLAGPSCSRPSACDTGIPLRDPLPADLASLTERQFDVTRLIAHGLTNAEIATRLFLGETTVKSHVTSIRAKLSVPATGSRWSCDATRPT